MFSRMEREEIMNMREFKFHCSDKITVKNGQKVSIPDFVEIRNDIINKLFKKGFLKVKQVAPDNANCIIRIYIRKKYRNESGELCDLYGYNCFVKKFGKWHSYSIDGNIIELDFEECEIPKSFKGISNIDRKCDFFDSYVRIG